MTHDEARTMVSALADGELDARGIEALSSHLADCPSCSAFGERVRALSVLAQTLPGEEMPAGLAGRVGAGITVTPLRRPRPRLRTAIAFAAALAVALVASLGGLPLPTFRLPAAEAARALAQIKTFSMVREVTDFSSDSPRVTTERIWYRAPGFMRIERRTGGDVALEITRPGERYVRNIVGETREINLPPDANPVPEPLSPTVALLGRRLGPGPEVAGRPTIRVELAFGTDERRTALVDATRFVALGAERHAIITKETTIGGRLVETKRTISVRYNPPLADSLFAIPPSAPFDRGFRQGGLGSLPVPPAAVPERMTLVSAGAGPAGGAALFADGAFGVLVTVDGPGRVDDASRLQSVTVAGRPATLVLSLFDLPRVQFSAGGHPITVSAPLPPAQLVALASGLYPAE